MILKIFRIINHFYRIIVINISRVKIYTSLKRINKFERTKDGNILLDGIWENNLHWLRIHLTLKGIYKLHGNNFFVIKKKKRSFFSDLILKSFNIQENIIIDAKFDKKYTHQSKKILKNVISTKDLFNKKLKYNFPTFLFHDSHLRRNKIPTVNYNDKKKLIEDLALQLYLLDQISKYLDNYKFNAVIISHFHGMYYSTLVWLSLIRKTRVYIVGTYNNNLTMSIMKNVNNHKKMLYDLPYKSDISKLTKKHKDFISNLGRKYLKGLLSDKVSSAKLAGSYKYDNKEINSLKTLNKYLNFKKNKKLIIIYSHAYPDFPNYYGKAWYYDYFNWLLNVIKIAKKISSYNFLIKPHPAEDFYNCNTKDILSKIKLSENIKILNNKFSPDKKILKFSSLCITATGTAFFEHISYGKKALISNLHHSSDVLKEFTYSSFPELSKKIKNIKKVKKVSKKQMLKAQMVLGIIYSSFNKNLKLPYNWNHFEQTKALSLYLDKNHSNFKKEYKAVENFATSKFQRYQVYRKINRI